MGLEEENMKAFICSKTIDNTDVESVIDELLLSSKNSLAILRQTEHINDWKSVVEDKMKSADFVIFILGIETFKSNNIIWEYAKAKTLNKHLIGFKTANADDESIIQCQGFQVFSKADDCIAFMKSVYEDDRKLQIEQYKMMVGSTEKVTEQRSKVNNLFFTITSTMLSLSLVGGKAFDFSVIGAGVMVLLSVFALVTSYFWDSLVESYGKLNTGKFMIMDSIEKKLRTNMFEEEWQILQNEVGYKAHTKTERKIITGFRNFIFIVLAFELFYLGYKMGPINLNLFNL